MADAFPIAFLFFAGAAALFTLPKGPARAALASEPATRIAVARPGRDQGRDPERRGRVMGGRLRGAIRASAA